MEQQNTAQTPPATEQVAEPPAENKPGSVGYFERVDALLKDLRDASNKKDIATEKSLYKEGADLYKSLTGEDLMEKAALAAKEEIESEGIRVIKSEDILSGDNFNRELEGFKFRQQTAAMEKAFSMFSDEEKKQFADVNSFLAQMENKIQDMKKSGLQISREVFSNLVAGGYMLFNIKNSLLGEKLRIPVLMFKGGYKFKTMSKKDFVDLVTTMQNFFDLGAKQVIEEKLNRESSISKARWRKRKLRKSRELLQDLKERIQTTKERDVEKEKMMKTLEEEIRAKIQKKVEEETRQALENITDNGEVGVLSKLKDFEELERKTNKDLKKDILSVGKRLEKQIKDREKEEKRISRVIQKEKKKAKISSRRVKYIKTEAEKEKGDKGGEGQK